MIVLKMAFVRLIYIIEVLIFVRSFLSIIARDINNPIISFIYQVTEPILLPFREVLRKLKIDTGMMDFSPLLAILFLSFLSGLF